MVPVLEHSNLGTRLFVIYCISNNSHDEKRKSSRSIACIGKKETAVLLKLFFKKQQQQTHTTYDLRGPENVLQVYL